MGMIALKLLANILLFVIGVAFAKSGKVDISHGWYPRWVGISEIVIGILTCIFSFSVWFVK